MADVVNTPPVSNVSEGGSNIPPKDDNVHKGDNDLKINELIEKQMEAFKDTFISQFNKEYSDKLTKLQNDNLELEEKKQRLVIGEMLRAADLDGSSIDFVYDKDIEVSKMKIIQLKELIDIEAQKRVVARLGQLAYVPPTNTEDLTPNKKRPKYFL